MAQAPEFRTLADYQGSSLRAFCQADEGYWESKSGRVGPLYWLTDELLGGLTMRTILIACVTVFLVGSPTLANDLDEIRASFEGAVAALNAGNLDGFLDTVHDDALSFYSCGPTSGKQGREACALDWQLFFNTTTDARFEARNIEYRIVGDVGFAYGEYALSVNYNGRGRQTVHEGRYTMTYTKVDGEWRIAMQHNTPAGDAPQPVRKLRPSQQP